MPEEKCRSSREIAIELSKETDPEKLSVLAEELNRALFREIGVSRSKDLKEEPPRNSPGSGFNGASDPGLRKRSIGPRLLQVQHQSEKRRWSQWKRLFHRFQRCPACKART